MNTRPESAQAQCAGIDGAPHDCGACPLAMGRRRFLRSAALAVVASLAVAGGRPTAALAENLRTVTPRRAFGAMRSYPIPATDGVSIDAANDVILARWRGRASAFSLRCPHRGTRLQWHADEARVFCPKHRARFLPDGAHDSGRSTRPLDRYALARRGEAILVDTTTLYRADENPAGWGAAVIVLP